MSDDHKHNNLVSFEAYQRRGSAGKRNAFAAAFDKTILQQKPLLDWYRFHRFFNKHRLFVHTLLRDNECLKDNPNTGFVVCYERERLERICSVLGDAAAGANRPWLSVHCAELTFKAACRAAGNQKIVTNVDAFWAVADELLTSDKIVLVSGLSRCRTAMDKVSIAYAWIKLVDDMWVHQKTLPRSTLVLIDSPGFLAQAWPRIGRFLDVLG